MKTIVTLLFLFFTSSISFSQFNQYPRPGKGLFMGGVGTTWIDDGPHYTVFLAPELSFENFGAGLDLRLTFDTKGNLREETFNDFSDYISIVRYFRYGLKNDPVFIKLGALDYFTLGHGSIMYLYNNSPSFDNRKAGFIMDIDFGSFGLESIYSRFAEAGVIGFRGYVRPLHYTSLVSMPLLNNFEIGLTYAVDFNENAGIAEGFFNSNIHKFETITNVGSINIFGFDIGLPVISSNFADVTIYYDFAHIVDFGSGSATGIVALFNPLGLVQVTAKLERRFNGEEYIPSYFNSFYEIERFRVTDKSSGTFSSKARTLADLADNNDGWCGELEINAVDLVCVIGSYQRSDKTAASGILHFKAELTPKEVPFVLRGGYDKINIKNTTDLFTLDDRSYLFTEAGYKPYPFMIISLVYNWTFTPVRDVDDNIVGYKPQERIEPRFYLVVPFDIK